MPIRTFVVLALVSACAKSEPTPRVASPEPADRVVVPIEPPASSPPPEEATQDGRVAVTKAEALDGSALGAGEVLQRIKSAYMAGIRHCYKERLKLDASARGKLVVGFTVDATGRAIDVKLDGFDPTMDACVATTMATWKFPIPLDRSGGATTAAFSFTLQLVPD